MTTSRPSRFAVFVNESANDGHASLRWSEIKGEVAAQLPDGTFYHCFKTPHDTEPLVKQMLQQQVDGFISAGGDGSAHYLLNMLLRLTGESATHLFLGGIGLGSSNDFIKPKQHFIQNIPVRIGMKKPVLADVGKVVFAAGNDQHDVRYFIANASMGITAEANWLFNQEDWLIRFTKKRWVKLAILYTALKTIFNYKNYPAKLRLEGIERSVRLSNLAMLKNPHVSGNFRYDQPVMPNDGWLGMNLCDGMTKFELICTLIALGKGHFTGRPKTFSAMVKNLSVGTQGLQALELDGEVMQAKEVHFSLLPAAVHLLSL